MIKKYKKIEIAPDEIFLDSSNLPQYNKDQFEGRIEKPLGQRVILLLGIFFVCLMVLYSGRFWFLEVKDGQVYAKQSQQNSLDDSSLFADRGVITDKNNVLLAWNEPSPNGDDYAIRKYDTSPGLSSLLGYIKYPQKDKSGNYYNTEYDGKDGVEKWLNTDLTGQNGTKIIEKDALGNVISQSVSIPPTNGQDIQLSVDSKVQTALYNIIAQTAQGSGFEGGAGIIMNVHTGAILAMTTYPEYNSQILTDGQDAAAIQNYVTNPNNAFLNRATSGLYTPGSIVKPYVALAAQEEKIIDPNKVVHTIGYISVPNPYNPTLPSIFKDWQNNGDEDMERAIAMSSDVYFYEIGGGYQSQPGLGVDNIKKYLSSFGLGQPFKGMFSFSPSGTIPDPAWKAANFNGQAWNIGDTYHTAIGQYGWQVTPLQMIRSVSAIANGGTLLEPTVVANDTNSLSLATKETLITDPNYYSIVREGMRQGVEYGVAKALNNPTVEIAAKTGTAQLGVSKHDVNSWVTGFFPFQDPQYAFAIVMERAPETYPIGAPGAMANVINWMITNTPEYLK